MTAAVPSAPAIGRAGRKAHVEVFVAACSGSARLSGEIGLPLVHVDASPDAAASIRRLREREHGAGARVPDLHQPIGFHAGWDDWQMFPYAPGRWVEGSLPRPDGVRAHGNRLMVSLPAGAAAAEFREQLHAALRHLRLQDVTSATAYMEARSDDLVEHMVQPRYTRIAADAGYRRATLVTDLYVLDPAETPWKLFWTVVAARSALEGRGA